MISTILALLLSLQEPVTAATPTVQPLSQFTVQCAVPGASTAATYQWQTVEGPTSAPFGTPTAQSTTVSFIEQGTYLIRCVVSDTGKVTTWADQAWVVGANFIPAPAPVSVLKPTVVQIPPPDVTDTIKPVIAKVMYGPLQLTDGQTVTLTTSVYAGLNVTASDNTAVQSAQLLVDNNHVHSIGVTSRLPASFFLWWLDGTIGTGLHPAVIRVYDSAGNFAVFKVTLRR